MTSTAIYIAMQMFEMLQIHMLACKQCIHNPKFMHNWSFRNRNFRVSHVDRRSLHLLCSKMLNLGGTFGFLFATSFIYLTFKWSYLAAKMKFWKVNFVLSPCLPSSNMTPNAHADPLNSNLCWINSRRGAFLTPSQSHEPNGSGSGDIDGEDFSDWQLKYFGSELMTMWPVSDAETNRAQCPHYVQNRENLNNDSKHILCEIEASHPNQHMNSGSL